MKNSSVIKIRNADLFLAEKQVLFDINWEVSQGDNWFVLGPNGSGKTTLTRMIMGYIWPKFGAEITVNNNTFGKCDVTAVRKDIAWVSPFLGNWTSSRKWTVEEIVISGIDSTIGLFRDSTTLEKEKAFEILKILESIDLYNKLFTELSSGEQIKVLIARALISKPRIMILDEACAYLDLKSREFLLDTIDRLANDNNSPAIIFVTQRIEDIIPALNKGLIISDGRIITSGDREKVLTENNIEKTFNMSVKLIKTKSGRLWPFVDR